MTKTSLCGAGATPRTVDILQHLIRFDTTNPPGNETACIQFIGNLLDAFRIEHRILGAVENRANLVARIKGRGTAPPLMLYGHVDVVTTRHQQWTVPPFEGRLSDGFVWGRGALDMKGGIAMMLSAVLDLVGRKFEPAGDILLVMLSDEETGGRLGAGFLAERYPQLLEGVRWALGEFGGHTTYVGPRRFYPIQIAEKQLCWMKATLHGPGGHGARPLRNGAMARLGRMLTALDRRRLPVRVTPVTRRMVATMAEHLGGWRGAVLGQLCRRPLAAPLLRLLGRTGKTIEPMFRNTVNATIVAGGEKINVVPSKIEVDLDGRLLPGFGPQEFQSELRRIIGGDVALEVSQYEPHNAPPNMHLFDYLSGVLRRLDPEGVPIPFLMPAITDARHFARLGIQTYGFTPMKLPRDFDFIETVHAGDERIPVAGLEFGTRAIREAIMGYTG